MVEIKCPNTTTHIRTLITKKVERKYMLQMLWQMVCTDREWCDFVSYDNRLPEEYRLCIIRMFRDNPYVDELEVGVAVDAFLIDLDRLMAEVKKAVR